MEKHSLRVWIRYLTLILASITAVLLLAEFLVRLISPQELMGQAFEFAPRGYKVHRSHGTATQVHDGVITTQHFTPPHLRGAPAPIGAARILMLGDSFTEGWLLNENETYIGRLQTMLDGQFGYGNVALLNAGVRGSGTADQLAFLEDFGEVIAPAAVIDVVGIDDFGRAQRTPLYRLTTSDGLELVAGSVPRNPLLKAIITSPPYNLLCEHSHLMQLIRAAARTLAPTVANPNVARPEELETATAGSFLLVTDQQRQLARALFRRMKKWCDERGVRFAVINNGWRNYDWLHETLNGEGITSYDASTGVQSAISTDLDSFVIPGDRHPNAKGAEATADAMWPFLRVFVIDNKLTSAGRVEEKNN